MLLTPSQEGCVTRKYLELLENVPFNRHVVVVVGGDDDDDDDDDNIGFNILRCRRPDLSEIQPTCGTTLLLKTAEKD